jgi:pimeloyl-ACP methyl ester carboxylesterase
MGRMIAAEMAAIAPREVERLALIALGVMTRAVERRRRRARLVIRRRRRQWVGETGLRFALRRPNLPRDCQSAPRVGEPMLGQDRTRRAGTARDNI